MPGIVQSVSLLIFCLSLQTPLRAQPARLDFDAALALARERSQQLAAERAARTAAEELAVAAGQRPDPVLVAGIDNLPVSGDDSFELMSDFMTMRSVGVEFELLRSERREARAARFAAAAESATASEAVALAALERATSAAWLDCYYLEATHLELLRAREQAALQVDAADVAFRGGPGSESEAVAARLAVAQIDDRIASVQRDITLARLRLARWTGATASIPLGELPDMDDPGPHGTDIGGALSHHPGLLHLAKEVELARAQAEVARTDRDSDWSIGLMYHVRSPNYSNMLSVRASRSLRLKQRDRQDRELAAQLALVRRASAELEEATRMHRAESESLLTIWQANRARIERFDTELLPLARQRSAAAMAAYRGGTGTLSSVLEARLAEVDVVLDRIALANETALTWAELYYLVPAGGGDE